MSENADTKPVYSSLQDWMERTGTNQKQLARLARLSEPHLSRILTRSRRCSLDVALRLQHITGVPVENLVVWSGVRPRASFEHSLKRGSQKCA